MSNYRVRHVRSGDPASSDFLMHFGIRGMKWGVRRFQNEDGSLTAAGRERYSTVSDRQLSKGIHKMQKSINKSLKKTEKLNNKTIDALFDNGPYWRENVIKYNNKNVEETVHREKDKKTLSELKSLVPTVNQESDYVKQAGSLVEDPKAMKKVQRAIDDLRHEGSEDMNAASKACVALENYGDAYDDAWDEFSHRWKSDNPGKAWTGDGTEFGNELEKNYPVYKESREMLDRAISDFVKKVNKLAKDPKIDNLPGLEKYLNFSEKIEGNNGTWYRMANVKAWAIANVLSPREIKQCHLIPEFFIESYDSNGKRLPSLYFTDE